MTKRPASSLGDIFFPRVTLDGEIEENHATQGITLKNRFEHTHIIGGTGQGKTQLIQYLISCDLKEDCTVVVIDNQRQMIPKLSQLGYDTQFITPHYPQPLNIFAMPRSHTTASLLGYVLSGIMNAPLTPKQEIIFQFGVTLMIANRGTITDFQSLLEGAYFDLTLVDPTTQRFFETQFYTRQYEQTRQEISWRIWSLLKHPILRDMLSAKENECVIDLNKKLILIDTDIDLLQDYSGVFGRIFLAQLLQAAQHRFTGNHRPVYIYIDECYYYLDHSIVSMLETARKAQMGLILAHQFLGQITEPRVSSALTSLTSTKYAGGLSPSDKHTMAQAMQTLPEILDVPKLHFALWQRGRKLGGTTGGFVATYVKDPLKIVSNKPLIESCAVIKVPVGVVEKMPKTPFSRPKKKLPSTKKAKVERMRKYEEEDIKPTCKL